MAEPEVTPEAPADAAVEAKARQMGWAPKDRWRGDPEQWIDAAAFVKRGEEILPIIRHNNDTLLAKNSELQQRLDAEREERKALEKTVKDLAEFQAAEVARQVKERTKDLRKQIREAREAGNDALEEALSDELDEVKEKAAKSVSLPKPAAPAPPPPPIDSAYAAWQAANADWFGDGKDLPKTHLAVGIAADIRRDNPALTGTAFFAELDKRLEKFVAPAPKAGKVEGGSGGGGEGKGGGSSYADLPADAKAVCDSQAKLFVGEKGKLYKDVKQWRAHYAEVFFGKQGGRV